MSDRGHELTDELIEQLEKKIAREYSQAYKEVSEKLERYLKRFEAKDEEKRKQLDAGEITKEEYAKWRKGQILSGQRWAEMKDTLAEDLKTVDTKVRSIIGDHMPDAYALNHNYATFAVEKDSMLNTSYTLYNRRTVENLLKDDENLLPYPLTESKTAQKLRERADLIWNRQKINDSITQGVLQGEPIRDIAKRLKKVVGMDGSAAVRNARTMMTAVENKGREDAFDSLEEKGVQLTKVWIATLDDRTRHSHRLLHGEEKNPETGKYSNGLQYPGDPFGNPEEVYNCRCSEIAHVKGFPINIPKWSPKMGDMTFEEWINEKGTNQTVAKTSEHTIANGENILASWERRKDKFDFEIEDVINAQGFDGVPRVVPKDEFDKYVSQSNNGQGFIAQRTYSAPDRETLDAYRDQLYSGKWYVDCSTGGAQYGQGMYCAADYTGNISDGMKDEMNHYVNMYVNLAETTNKDKLDHLHEIAKSNSLTEDEEKHLIFRSGLAKEAGLKWKDMIDPDTLDQSIVEKIESSYIADVINYKKQTPYYIETFTLDPTAKIVTYKDLDSMRSFSNVQKLIVDSLDIGESEKSILHQWIEDEEDISDLPKDLQKTGQFVFDRSDVFMNMDYGSLATSLGYDAINAEGHGASGSYTIILNRTKCIFLKGE